MLQYSVATLYCSKFVLQSGPTLYCSDTILQQFGKFESYIIYQIITVMNNNLSYYSDECVHGIVDVTITKKQPVNT